MGCGSGSTTVEQPEIVTPVVVHPTDVNVTIIIEEVVEEIPVEEVPGGDVNETDIDYFEGLTTSYDMSDLTCRGGDVIMTMLFKTHKDIDEFAFMLSHTVDGSLIDFSNVNVVVGKSVTKITDTIYVEKNKTNDIVRHGISVSYYDDEVTKLSNHYFDIPVCKKK